MSDTEKRWDEMDEDELTDPEYPPLEELFDRMTPEDAYEFNNGYEND